MSQRSDARRNRAKILAAAEEIFAAESVSVPLQLVAERAQVGRGTLYRHFPDRQSLVAAVFEDRLAVLEQLVADRRGDPSVLLSLLRDITAEQARMPGLFRLVFSEGPDHLQLEPLRRRAVDLLAGPLEWSRGVGVVRADLTVDDLLTIVSMVYGVVNGSVGPVSRVGAVGPAGRADAAAVSRAMDLVIDGLLPRS
ncbi:DNA-binding transcriptional repressor AcrR [mine drainage metagenome]|uniref:DNA-binding transcriptional repressor AcrR n=1 Tax=mine drainage metagenome TaxID=410659 RepID=A0A1J5QCL3_9ZZZZ